MDKREELIGCAYCFYNAKFRVNGTPVCGLHLCSQVERECQEILQK